MAPVSESLSLIRTFNSETNPSRPMRPSPLTNSTIQGMPLDLLDRIRSFPLFQTAPEAFLAAIGTHLRPQSHSPNDYILTEGDDSKAMYWLVRGVVAVTSRDGESTYAELKTGAFFGEIGVLMGIPRTATILARTKCMLIVLKKEDLMKELPNFPEVENTIREEAQERLSILQRKKKERLAFYQDDILFPPNRGEKRPRDKEDVGVLTPDSSDTALNGSVNFKKRKSPSPSLVEITASSALGSGLVNVRALLKELPLFAGLPSELLHFLGSNARQCTYPPFTDIVQQGSQGREVFFIVRGEVEVIGEKITGSLLQGIGTVWTGSRGAQVKARLRQGQYFGELASLSLAPRRTATVRSVTSVECLLITGDVLSQFWLRCPMEIREQIELTAKQRLLSTCENDIPMTGSFDIPPPIDELAIRDRPSKSPKSPRNSIPRVALDFNGPESPKPSRIEDRQVLAPVDPDPYDPYLNVDLDNTRLKSRRSSLAPPIPAPEASQEPHFEDRRPDPKFATPPKPRSTSTSGLYMKAKRARIKSRRPSVQLNCVLPENLLVLIFQHLQLHELMHLRLVSSDWAKLLRESPDLLHNLNLSQYNRKITDEVLLTRICRFVGQRPRQINISNCFHMTDDGFTALAKHCGSNVTSWKMKSVWDVTATAVLEMVKSAKGLEDIDLSNCRKVNDTLLAYIVGTIPQQLPTDQSLQRGLNGRTTTARSAATSPQPAYPPSPLIGSQRLKKLTLSYCKHVTDRSMHHIGQFACWRLEEIDLTRCTTITDHGFQTWNQHNFTRLRKLCLADCTYLTHNAIMYLTNAAKGLQDLDLVSALVPYLLA
ncbi:hypothetical protein MMC19_005589 [Ptychographa xylographoides]|nr:hypothetical protein [Ptychographa xylographoides]